jgi:hypothetical protein
MTANSDWDLEDPRPQKSEGADYSERMLWAAVITLALRDASSGDPFALNWFQDPSSPFISLCGQMNLHPAEIREHIAHSRCKRPTARLLTAKGVKASWGSDTTSVPTANRIGKSMLSSG